MKKDYIREFGMITIAMFFVAVGVYFFLVPSGIVVGSVSGLALVLSQLINVSMSAITFVLNAVLLIIGFIFIGKEFGAKTVYTSMLLPFFLAVFEYIVPINESLTGNSVYDLASYILILAMGQALLFNVNASSGGLDIVAKIINKYTHMEIGKAVTIAGMAIALSSILVYDIGTLIVSILGTYANGQAVDYFVDGFNKRKRICIISDDYEAIQEYIMKEMNRGTTLYIAKGGYDKKERIELQTIMTSNEYKQLLNYLNHSDFDVFLTVSTVNEVVGKWNINRKKRK